MPQVTSLWSLALDRQYIDPSELAASVVEQVRLNDLDFRTRLLIRDSIRAIQRAWPVQRFQSWLFDYHLESLASADLGDDVGFPSLVHRVMESTKKETVLQFLRELGSQIPQHASLAVGGSIALMLVTDLSRKTEDIDVVDEIPPDVRSEHALLDSLAQRYGLRLTHFQSHYLPSGWEQRLRSFGRFGKIDVSLVDPMDVLLSKLFSARPKDRDDLRQLLPQADKTALVDRLKSYCGGLLGEAKLHKNAEQNWYIVFGEPLPA